MRTTSVSVWGDSWLVLVVSNFLSILCGVERDSSFFAVTQQQWRACVRRMLRSKLGLYAATLFPWSQIGIRSIRRRKGRKSWQICWRQAPTEQPWKKHRAGALALLSTALAHDSGKIRDGSNFNSRYKRRFLPVRSSSFTCNETSDRASHSSKLAWTFGWRKLGCRWHGWNWKLGFAGSLKNLRFRRTRLWIRLLLD